MPPLALYAAVLFTIACAFYSVGIWAEFIAKRLKPWHAIAFLFGVVADTLATGLMVKFVGGLYLSAHTLVGIFGLGLMILHLVWAVLVLAKGNEAALARFHRFSVLVWSIWMVAYLSGVYVGMSNA